VERHRRPPYEHSEIILEEANIHLFTQNTKRPVNVEWRAAGSSLCSRRMQAGDVGIAAEGLSVSGRCFGASEITIVAFNPSLLARVAADTMRGGSFELQPLQHNSDRQIRTLASLLELEAEARAPAGRIYGESIGVALAAYMLRNYAVGSLPVVLSRGGLSTHNIRRVLDYMRSNLANDIGIEQLAEVANVSAFHFCRAFKHSIGVSPHQYILRLRIEKAQTLLRNTDVAIVEIGKQVGFTNPSHFIRVFRRMVGPTPRCWRAKS
jgi:AraC family transcriptional regulator